MRYLESEFRQSGRTACCDERVRARFERRETGPHDKQNAAESRERAFHRRGPEHERAHAVDAETRDKGPAVPEFPHDPAGVGGGTDEVGALQAAGFCGGDVEAVLEFGV